MIQTNWQSVKIRCSSLGDLFTEPRNKGDKEQGLLSETAKTALKRVYIKEKYNRERDIVTRPMRKGIDCEQDSILLLSQLKGIILEKNEDNIQNEFITGTPDIVIDKHTNDTIIRQVIDIKTSENIWTFHDNVLEKADAGYFAQLQGYMYLTGASNAEIAYCLTNASDQMILEEQMWAFKKCNYVTEESPDFIKRCQEIEKELTYDDIPLQERIFIVKIARDEDFIAKIPQKVAKAREFLLNYDNDILNLNK